MREPSVSSNERKLLRRIRNAAAQGVLLSSISRQWRPLLKQFRECGAIKTLVDRRAERVKVDDADAFARLVQRRHPGGLDVMLPRSASRIEAAGIVGDAKAVRQGSAGAIFLRSSQESSRMFNTATGAHVSIFSRTCETGAAAIVLNDTARWGCSGTIALVENKEPFLHYERVMPEVDFAVYSSGKISERLLRWIASEPMSKCRYVHWGDYDPAAGVDYLRLCAVCPGRVEFYLPSLIAELLPQYGKSSLVTKQVRQLNRIRRSSDDPVIGHLLSLFDRYGRGLEQEVLFRYLSRPEEACYKPGIV
jgi:hypothetical protein